MSEFGLQFCEDQFADLLHALTTPPCYSTLRVNTQVGSVTDTLKVLEETVKQVSGGNWERGGGQNCEMGEWKKL